MKKGGALTILGTMIMIPFLVWGGTTLVSHAKQIATLEANEKNSKELLQEVRSDVKLLLKRIR